MSYLKRGRITLAAVMSMTAVIPAGSQEASYYYRQLKTGQVGQVTPPGESTGPFSFSLANDLPAEAMVGVSIPQVGWSLSGGKAPYFVTATGAPNGLNTNGSLSGMPGQHGTFPITLTARDSSSPAKTQTVSGSMTVYAPFAAIPSATPQSAAEVGQLINPVTIVANGGKPPYTFGVVDGALPAGVGVNQSTGVLSGSPEQSGNFSFRLRASESFRPEAPIVSDLYTMVVAPALISFNLAQTPPAEVWAGTSFSTQLSASGAPGPFTFSGTSLPPGFTVNGSTFGGQFSTAGTFTYQLKAANGQSDVTRQYTTAVYSALTASLSGVPQVSATSGTPITNVTLSPSGGKGPYTYGTTGSLPPGVTFDSGTLSGTPYGPGTYSFALTVAQSFGNVPAFSTSTFTMNVAAEPITLALSPNPPTEVMAGTPFSTTLSATGGPSPYTFSGIDLPNGMTLAGDVLSGNFSTAGNLTYSLKAANAQTEVTRQFATVSYAPFSAVLSAVPQAEAVALQSITPITVQVQGGKDPYIYSSTGTIPPGLNFDNGVLSGQPSTPGTYKFALSATHSFPGAQPIASSEYTMTVAPAPLSVAGVDLQPEFAIGKTLNNQASITASSGTAPYTYTATGLPPGMSFTGNVTSGAPNEQGTYTVTLRAADSSVPQRSGTRTFSITAYPELTVALAKPAYLNSGGALDGLVASSDGGKGTGRVFSVVSGALPPGMGLNANGTFTGTPSGSGTATFRIRVQDELGTIAEQLGNDSINYAPALTINGTLADAKQNEFYDKPLFQGGRGPYTTTVTTGSLPAGLAISTTNLAGIPSGSGPATFGLTVKDADGRTATQTVSFTITSSATGASRALISSASYAPLAGTSNPGSLYINYVPPSYVGARTSNSSNAADMAIWAKHPDNPPISATGTVLITGNATVGGLTRFSLTYTFSQDVLASSLDQVIAFGETAPCAANQNVSLLVEGSLTGAAGSYSTLINVPAVKGSATSLGTGYGGSYYSLNQTFTPTTVRYVKATYVSTSCNTTSSSILVRQGIVK